MIKIAVCDDDASAISLIEHYLDEYRQVNSRTAIKYCSFTSSRELEDLISSGARYHIYLLDIIMPYMTGIQTARYLKKHDPECIVVFLTSSKEYAYDAYAVNALQYLLKPFDKFRFFQVLDRAVDQIKEVGNSMYTITTPEGICRIPISSIIFAEVKLHTLYFHLNNHTTLQSITQRVPFDQSIAGLFTCGQFVKPHQSYIINMDYISRFEKKGITMTDSSYVPIAKLRYRETKDAYLDYLEQEAEQRVKPANSYT